MTVKFLHYRAFGPQQQKDGSSAFRAQPRLGATVAYTIGELGTSYAVAYCGPRDNYNKHMGRAKARGRLNSMKYLATCGETKPGDFVARMDAEMSYDHGYYRSKELAEPVVDIGDQHDYFGG